MHIHGLGWAGLDVRPWEHDVLTYVALLVYPRRKQGRRIILTYIYIYVICTAVYTFMFPETISLPAVCHHQAKKEEHPFEVRTKIWHLAVASLAFSGIWGCSGRHHQLLLVITLGGLAHFSFVKLAGEWRRKQSASL